MSALTQLSDYLALDHPADEWEEHGVIQAAAIIDRFVPEDWRGLAYDWKSNSLEWNRRLADVMMDAPPPYSVPLLLTMLEHGEEGLLSRVCDVLRVHLQGLNQPIPVHEKVVERVKSIANTKSPMKKQSVDILLDKLVPN